MAAGTPLALAVGLGIGAWWSPRPLGPATTRSHTARSTVGAPAPTSAAGCTDAACQSAPPVFSRASSGEVTPLEHPSIALDEQFDPPNVTSTVPPGEPPLFYVRSTNTADTVAHAEAYDWSGRHVGHVDAVGSDGHAAPITPSPDGSQLLIRGSVYSADGRWLRFVGGSGAWSSDGRSLCTIAGGGGLVGSPPFLLAVAIKGTALRPIATLPAGGTDFGNRVAICDPAHGRVVIEFVNNLITTAYSVIHVGQSITVDTFRCHRCPHDFVPAPDGQTVALSAGADHRVSLLDVATGKTTPTTITGTPKIFASPTTLLVYDDFLSRSVYLYDMRSERATWEGGDINVDQVVASNDEAVAFITGYHSLTGPRVTELDIVTAPLGQAVTVNPIPD